ncbi:MAG: phosphoadenosine phosphosulfate reductase family protein, partial [Gammaproteobacteria bacterium]|nr:phosphoadenosine phosphosulfate reductase family protein [Gammaproteobacteria bacterium]
MKRQFISYSGGKDSTALALLYPDAIPVFTDTGMEFPEMYEQINKFESITGREIIKIRSRYGTLRDYILDSKFLPGHGARYCTRIFKIQTFDNWIKATFPGD